jgi:molybdopterin-guanine dinucleotide biosynthesis protein A
MPPDLAAAAGTHKRCLIELKGETLLERVLSVVFEAFTSALVAVNLGRDEDGADVVSRYGPNATHFVCTGGLLDAIMDGLDVFAGEKGDKFFDEEMLLLNVDLPLITAQHLLDVVAQALELEADGFWPIVERKVVEQRFPTTKRTYVRTRQGTFTGGNAFLLKPRLLRDNRKLLEKVYRSRKNPLALASVFSSKTLMRVLAGTISLPDLEQEFSQRFGANLHIAPFPHPEVAMDLDKLSDFELYKSLLAD